MGAERFRALPLTSLTRAELTNSTPDPTMYAKTVPATLGSVHAFLSHSWRDDGDCSSEHIGEGGNEYGESSKRVAQVSIGEGGERVLGG